MPATLDQILTALNTVNRKLDVLMSQQDAIDSAVQALTAVLTDVQADAATLVTDLTALASSVAAGQPVNTDALTALVANAQSVQAALDAATAQVTAIAPPPAG